MVCGGGDGLQYVASLLHACAVAIAFAWRTSLVPKPWPWWRINFYRYDYPQGPGGRYELTAWSPTHEPSFHVPSRFGVARLVE